MDSWLKAMQSAKIKAAAYFWELWPIDAKIFERRNVIFYDKY